MHFDFASTLCYVAHRVMERMELAMQDLGLRLVWTPVDLTSLIALRRGVKTPEIVRQNGYRVAKELDVSLRIPSIWIDSRIVNAAAIIAENQKKGAIWRERIFSLHFEQGSFLEDGLAVQSLARKMDIGLTAAELSDAMEELEMRTRSAEVALVMGVPTFMLGNWPFGGIQNDSTMEKVFGRFASRARGGLLN